MLEILFDILKFLFSFTVCKYSMNKTLSRFFRRKSISETELKKDYPVYSDESDFTDDERRHHEWQRHLNRDLDDDMEGVDKGEEDRQWEYESDYNFSVGSSVSIIDAYRESKYRAEPKMYSDRDLERCIEARMKDEFSTDALRRYSLNPNPDVRGKDRDRPANRGNTRGESPRQKQNFKPVETGKGSVRRESSDRHDDWDTNGKRKVRKQVKQRRRARDVSPDVSDDDSNKYKVNISMDELNNIIKKNISSVVKTIVTATSKKTKMTLDESFSTETETIFSGSSSHSTDIPAGLLQKQIKAQLDSDKLRGIIRNAVAQEAQDHRRNSVHPNMTVPRINEIPPSPCTSHRTTEYLPTTGHPNPHSQQYATQQQPPPPPQHSPAPSPTPYQHPLPTATVVPPPPPPPPPPPIQAQPPQVTFNIPLDQNPNLLHPSFPNRRTSLLPGLGNFPGNQPRLFDELGLQTYDPVDDLSPSQLARLRNRRHTLANLADDGLDSGMDKLEQFSNALKLLDKTLKREDSTEAKQSEGKTDEQENKPPEQVATTAASPGRTVVKTTCIFYTDVFVFNIYDTETVGKSLTISKVKKANN